MLKKLSKGYEKITLLGTSLLLSTPLLMAGDTVIKAADIGDSKASLLSILNMPLFQGGVYAVLLGLTVINLGKGAGFIGGDNAKVDVKQIVVGVIFGALLLSWTTIATALIAKFSAGTIA